MKKITSLIIDDYSTNNGKLCEVEGEGIFIEKSLLTLNIGDVIEIENWKDSYNDNPNKQIMSTTLIEQWETINKHNEYSSLFLGIHSKSKIISIHEKLIQYVYYVDMLFNVHETEKFHDKC